MRKLSRSRRDSMVVEEANKVGRVFAEQLSRGEDPQVGIDALETYWRSSRRSPVARWIRYYVTASQVELLRRGGRLGEALSLSSALESLPATPYARITAALTRASLLHRLARPDETFQCAMSALRICARTRDPESARGLILAIARLDNSGYIEELAGKYGDLVMEASRLPNFVELVGPQVRTPLEAMKALKLAMQRGVT